MEDVVRGEVSRPREGGALRSHQYEALEGGQVHRDGRRRAVPAGQA